MPSRAAAPAVRVWLHDRVCVGYRAPNRYCDGDVRRNHARTQTANAKQLIAATSPQQLAELIHHQMCAAWLERNHGVYYIERSNQWCGMDGVMHIAAIQSSPMLSELACLIGIDT